MKCQNCGADNTYGARFCEKCGGALETVSSNQTSTTTSSSNKKVSFNIKNIFTNILNSILHPIKAFENLNNDSLANNGIYAGFLILAVTIINVLVYIIYFATKDYFKYKLIKAGDIVKYGFELLGYLVLFIALAAFIYKVASLFLKKDIEFKKILVGILVGFTTAILAKYVVSTLNLFLTGKFFTYLFGTINMFALLYSIFYTIRLVTKDFGAEDEKGTLLNIICLTILFALSTYVLADWFTDLTKWNMVINQLGTFTL